jgi:hypothetical protein
MKRLILILVALITLAISLPAKPIFIETPYLLGDYVEFVANPARGIPASAGTIVMICVSEETVSYAVLVDNRGVLIGITPEMIKENKEQL